MPTRNEGNVFVSMIIFQPFKKRTTYSKKYLYPPEEQIFTAGKNPMVLEYKTEVISPAICYETTNKAHCEFAKRNNATIYIASVLSSIKGIDTELKLLSEIAKNNNLITFMANYVGKSGGYECAGKSSVWNEEGELIGQLGDKEGLIIFDTKSKEIIKMKKTNKRVLLFLPQGFEEYEAGVFTDVIGWSRVIGIEPVEVVTAGLRHEVKCKWNFNVRPEISFEDINISDYDALAIPGGFEDAGFYEDAFDERFLNLIRHFDKKGKIIAAVCAAALPVGKSGVLKGRNATTYDLSDGFRRKQLADLGANVQDKHIVIDKNIITSTGPATGLDVSFKLLEMLSSIENVNAVKKHMRFV